MRPSAPKGCRQSPQNARASPKLQGQQPRSKAAVHDRLGGLRGVDPPGTGSARAFRALQAMTQLLLETANVVSPRGEGSAASGVLHPAHLVAVAVETL